MQARMQAFGDKFGFVLNGVQQGRFRSNLFPTAGVDLTGRALAYTVVLA